MENTENKVAPELETEVSEEIVEEILEEVLEEIPEEAEENPECACESLQEKVIRVYSDVKGRVTDVAKSGVAATKNGVAIAKDKVTDVAKRGVAATKNGVGIAKDKVTGTAKTIAQKAKAEAEAATTMAA